MMLLLRPPHFGAQTLLFLLSTFFQQHMPNGGICRGVWMTAVVPPFGRTFILVFDPANSQCFFFHPDYLIG
jgi:hypothetical protein